MLNALFKLLIKITRLNFNFNVFNALYKHNIKSFNNEKVTIILKMTLIIFHITLIKLLNIFKIKLKVVYKENSQ